MEILQEKMLKLKTQSVNNVIAQIHTTRKLIIFI